jgi:hypothetical protein
MYYPACRFGSVEKSFESVRPVRGRYAKDLQSFGVRVRPFHCRVFALGSLVVQGEILLKAT